MDKTTKSIQIAMESDYDKIVIPFKTITYDNGEELCYRKAIADNYWL